MESIPTACHQTETAVLPTSVQNAWEFIRNFKVEKILPSKVKSTKFTEGGPGFVGAIIEVDWVDGS